VESIEGFFTLTRIGLVLNIVGTVMIALSFGRNLEETHQTDRRGRRVYLASFLHPNLFKLGLAIIIFGFLFQFIE
jgi:hypothetical protein